MIKVFYIFIFFIYIFSYNFDLYKKKTNSGNTLLVIGGIHGNEPGGYFAASMLVKYYTITKGNLYIVPNLNFDSDLRYKRGIHGDMNRKFNKISKNDKDYNTIRNIKKIILDKDVDLILNLHDGYGFYRKKYQNTIFNPNAWGQAFIIDQHKLDINTKFGNLNEIAQQVDKKLNSSKHLVKKYHSFGIKNTKTKFMDEQMQKSLTYFAVTHNKPAFAIETSKNINDLTQKVTYQLRSIEEFMKIVGIKYKRDFDLDSYSEVKKRVYDFGEVTINNNFTINLNNIRKTIKFVPLKRKDNIIKFTHPLGAIIRDKRHFHVHIGHIKVSKFIPDYFKTKKLNKKIEFIIDGKKGLFAIGDIITLKKSFKILEKNLRVNVIGYSSKKRSEANINIDKKSILKQYSLDKTGKIFRIEFYDKDYFVGLIRVRFE